MTTWSLQHSSKTATFARWGISGLQRRRSSQAMDVLSLTADGAPFDGTLPFSALDEITILRDGVQWFVGRVTGIGREASGSSEGIQYEISGPWWYLTQLVYQQVWQVYQGPQVSKSHCLLNTWADGKPMGVQAQLNDILHWVSTNAMAKWGSAPFQWVTGDFPDALIPSDEVRDITSAEALIKQLRWIPDAVTWWDYSTTPPTFRCRRRSQLGTVSIPVGSPVTAIAINPRHDLVVPSVVLKYERLDKTDNLIVASLFLDAYPPGSTGAEFGCLTSTIDLEGFSITSAEAAIVTAELPAAGDSGAWWNWLKTKEPWITDAQVQLMDAVVVTRENRDSPGAQPLPRELLRGQITDWMVNRQVADETVTIKARIRVVGEYSGEEILTKAFAVNITTTNAKTGTYRENRGYMQGETPPTGLAQVLYDALSVVEYQGAITLVRPETGADDVSIGMRVNLTAGRPEWEQMGAVIQEVMEDVESGTTTLRVGPPEHLGPRDLVELLRVNRFRFIYTPQQERAGQQSGGGVVRLGSATPRENGTNGSLTRERIKLATQGGGLIDINSYLTVGAPMMVREVAICSNGVEKRMLILASEPY